MEVSLEPSPDLCPPTSHCRRRYKGHVPGLDYSFGSTYGNATLKYFQDHRNAALENSGTPFSKGGHFPTLCSPNPDLVLCNRSQARARWLHRPSYTRFNLDSDRSTELYRFYQVGRGRRGLSPPEGRCLLSQSP